MDYVRRSLEADEKEGRVVVKGKLEDPGARCRFCEVGAGCGKHAGHRQAVDWDRERDARGRHGRPRVGGLIVRRLTLNDTPTSRISEPISRLSPHCLRPISKNLPHTRIETDRILLHRPRTPSHHRDTPPPIALQHPHVSVPSSNRDEASSGRPRGRTDAETRILGRWGGRGARGRGRRESRRGRGEVREEWPDRRVDAHGELEAVVRLEVRRSSHIRRDGSPPPRAISHMGTMRCPARRSSAVGSSARGETRSCGLRPRCDSL